MRKILSFIFLLSALFIFSTNNVYAQENRFLTYYNVDYSIKEDETTRVTINVELKNRTSEYFASSYALQTGFADVESINATDEKGPLSYKTQKNDKGTLISFTFNDKVVGVGNTQRFTISFDTNQIAKKEGKIWEVNIPGVSDQESYAAFNATVTTPPSLGKASFIKPAVSSVKSSGNTLSFSKADLGSSGISISYGDYQIYSFDLSYHLENKNLFPITTEIALPSDNSYQKVEISNIDPLPLDVEIDKDGNWIAKYRLSPSKKMDINVRGRVKISLIPRKETISDEDRKLYTSSQKHWETQDPGIEKLARELKTPEKIYQYVVDNLSYDETRVTKDQVRAGAKGVLENKTSAVCLEFTDLFIALARAAGIPARQVEGFANTNNSSERPLSLVKDVLHSWPQYYDEKLQAWVMVDPTWGNTTKGLDYFKTLDYDHFAFVVKGVSSEYPVPAGGYKLEGSKDSQDVSVHPSTNFNAGAAKLELKTDFPKKSYGGLPLSGKITVFNSSSVLAPNQSLKISSSPFSPAIQDVFIEKLPPYGKSEISLRFNPLPVLTNERGTIKISLRDKTIEKEIEVLPIYKNPYLYLALGGIVFVTTITLISIFAYKSRNIHVS